MDSAALIHQVREVGAEIVLSGDKITVRYASRLPDSLRHQLQENKADVIRALQGFSLPNFIKLVQHYGTDNGVLLEESAILNELDPEGITDLQSASTQIRQAWAEAIATRLVQTQGIIPVGWDHVARCQHCGPVYSFHDLSTLSCGWCDMRLAGKWFPQPEQKMEQK